MRWRHRWRRQNRRWCSRQCRGFQSSGRGCGCPLPPASGHRHRGRDGRRRRRPSAPAASGGRSGAGRCLPSAGKTAWGCYRPAPPPRWWARPGPRPVGLSGRGAAGCPPGAASHHGETPAPPGRSHPATAVRRPAVSGLRHSGRQGLSGGQGSSGGGPCRPHCRGPPRPPGGSDPLGLVSWVGRPPLSLRRAPPGCCPVF